MLPYTPKLLHSDITFPYEKAVDQLLVIAALEEEEVIVQNREQKLCIRLQENKMIDASSVKFIEAGTPGRIDGLWLIETTRSTRLNKEWVTPSSVVESHDGKVFIPVVNLSKRTIKVRGPWKVSAVTTYQTFLVNEEEQSTIGTVQPENESTGCEQVLLNEAEILIDPNVTGERRKELMEVIRRHWRCFLAKKGLTQLVEHRIETGTASPVHSYPYPVSEAERKVIQNQVKEMKEGGIVALSSSPWS
ncbi:hypothetical protein OUZ56_009493 [Daphnia magna]|uniref:Uncharacterized protein n=1 Tax=Daphnia magna TaxID=35525 RepID=A0ABR0AG50_9CRUS|nr:hypothetical protein OUZ56_009493 [Daphnia magna]